MKKIFAVLLALYSAFAFSTTLNPVQLLNPTGSSSGQAIVSTGASSAPAWGGIGVNGIASIAANTILANATGSPASPTAYPISSLFSSPTITTPTITGVTSGACASAGNVGECKNSNVPVGSPVSLTSSTYTTITSVSLTAGNWLCSGNLGFLPATTTSVTNQQAHIGTVAGSASGDLGGSVSVLSFAAITGSTGGANLLPIASGMVNVTSATTVYLTAYSIFTASTETGYGYINCVRWH